MTNALNLKLVSIKSKLCRVKNLEDVCTLLNREENVKEIRDTVADVRAVLGDRRRAQCELEWIIRTYPQLATALSLLRTNPIVINDENLMTIVLECILWFYSESPRTLLQNKSNFWVQAQIRHVILNSSQEELREITSDDFTGREKHAVQFLRRNYRLLDFVDDERICCGLHDKLLKHFVEFRDVRNDSVVREMWTKVKRNQLYLNPASMKNLWLLHRNSLEMAILQTLRSDNDEIHSQLIDACVTWPTLARHSLRILHAVFKRTNFHPKSLLIAREIIARIMSTKDKSWQCHQHPLLWLLSTNSNVCDDDSIWKPINEGVRKRVLHREQLVWWILLFPRCLKSFEERLAGDDNTEVLETAALLSHRSSGRCSSPAELCNVASLTSTCNKCLSLAIRYVITKMETRFERKIDEGDLRTLIPGKNFETVVKYN